MTARFFTCAHCHRELQKGWSEEEANAEALALFGLVNASERKDVVEVCDDCFKAMTNAYPPHQFLAYAAVAACMELDLPLTRYQALVTRALEEIEHRLLYGGGARPMGLFTAPKEVPHA